MSSSSSAALLSPPNSPRDHRHYIPRRPSPLSLPPVAPHISFASTSLSDATNHASGTTTGYYQPFSLTEFAVSTPRTSGVVKVPRYPLEKQRRALKDLEMEHRRQQMQKQNPMVVPSITTTFASSSADGTAGTGQGEGGSPQDVLPSPTTTLPLTPRSAASSVSSYSQHEDESGQRSRGKGGSMQGSLCATLFGSCFAAFAISSRRLESMNMSNVRTIASAR